MESNFKDVIEKIKTQADIVQIVSQYVDLKNNKALCLFHEEKHPSFSINPNGQYFYCFSCHVGGDVFKFIELIEKVSFIEAVKKLADQLGIQIAFTQEDQDQAETDRIIGDILSETAKFYHQSLTPEVKKYLLENRNFSEEIISQFQIGYAGWGLKEHLIDNLKFLPSLCIKAGILKEKDGKVQDYFYKRIIFPNLKHGLVVHLTGRCIDDTEPKYLHIPGEIKHLYNEDALSNKEVYIAEGVPDCLTATQNGYAAVAILGSGGFKEEYLPKLSRCERVNICLDPDSSGIDGALHIAELLGLKAMIVELPNGLDLNDYFKKYSKEDFDKRVTSAKNIIQYKLDSIPVETDKTKLPQLLLPILKLLAHLDKATQESYLSYAIKPRFGLKNTDTDSYRKIIDTEQSKLKLDTQLDLGRSISEILVELTINAGVEIYLDQFGEPHLTLPEKPLVGFPIKSSSFRRWLSGRYYSEEGKGISGETFSVIINTLEGKAFHENRIMPLFNRVAMIDNIIYYDLGDDKKVVKITAEGWKIIANCPVRFSRFKHQTPQVEPKPSGNLHDISKYVNLSSKSDHLLYLTYLPTALFPNIARAMPTGTGDQGSAKSTAFRIARCLIDPSRAGVHPSISGNLLSPPKDIAELAQNANHHYCLYLDNLSYLSEELSDALARFITGIGYSKRKLYSDDEDILFNQIVAVGITGISLVVQKPDLLDRSLILRFNRIPDDQREDETSFWARFNEEKPFLLGALFDTVAQVLKIAPTLKLSKKPRMADYAKYAAAAAIALGSTADNFLAAFSENVSRQNQAAIEASVTAQILLNFMKDKQEWTGSSSDLYALLKQMADDAKLPTGKTGFPKASNWLWRKILEVRPNLTALGLLVSRDEESANSNITLKKTVQDSKNTATTATESDEDMATMAASQLPLDEDSNTEASIGFIKSLGGEE
ncbi:MAG: CHC2 zinc finger domain-containing protein [Candidatus Daviesbacteria bacterium]|nr:CHC2 zinc finger domain-containing protein [Candidatus Daviesbacteria bacterium]